MPVGSGGKWYNDPERASRADVASAAKITTGTGSAFDAEDADAILGTLTVTAHAGTTPTLDVALETTVDGTNWYTVGAFPQVGDANLAATGRAFAPLGNQARWKWTIAGTSPSYTLSIAVSEKRDN
jgi:hypothetical protein